MEINNVQFVQIRIWVWYFDFLQGILMCLVSYFEFLFYELEMELLSDLKLSYIEVVCYKVVNFKEFVQDDDVKF